MNQYSTPISYRLWAGFVVGLISGMLDSKQHYHEANGSALWSLLVGGTAAFAIAILVPAVVRGRWGQRVWALILLAIPLMELIRAFAIAGVDFPDIYF